VAKAEAQSSKPKQSSVPPVQVKKNTSLFSTFFFIGSVSIHDPMTETP
jgi:hypothetical protein